MVRTIVVFASLVAWQICAADEPSRYEGGDLYATPYPYEVFRVKSVEIIRNGAVSNTVSGEESEEFCSQFVLTLKDVKSYFHLARRASFKEYAHDLDMSRCHAEGELVLSNGEHGRWQIDLERRGAIFLSGGRNLYFYCPKCRSKAFD